MNYSTPSFFDEEHLRHHPAFHTGIFGKSDSGKTSAIVQWFLRREGPAYNGFEEIHGFTKKAKRNIGSIWELMLEDPEYNKKYFTHRVWTDGKFLKTLKRRVKGSKPFALIFDDEANKLSTKDYKDLRAEMMQIRNLVDQYAICYFISQQYKGHTVGLPTDIRNQVKCIIIFGGSEEDVKKMIDDGFIVTKNKDAFLKMYDSATEGNVCCVKCNTPITIVLYHRAPFIPYDRPAGEAVPIFPQLHPRSFSCLSR